MAQKVCSGNVPMVLAAQQAKQNPEYYLIGAIQSTNPQFWGATYVPYETPSRLYANEMMRPSFYDEGCFSPQCDLQTMNTCTRIANVESIISPNWNAKLDSLYKSTDKYAESATARAFSTLHNQLAASTTVPMSGMGPVPVAPASAPGPLVNTGGSNSAYNPNYVAGPSLYVPLYPSMSPMTSNSLPSASMASYAITF